MRRPGRGSLRQLPVQRGTLMTASIVWSGSGLVHGCAALQQGSIVALANKECLVSAGAYFMSEARRGYTLLPVNWNTRRFSKRWMRSNCCKHVGKDRSYWLRGAPSAVGAQLKLPAARPEDALKHPNWTMGRKITIDSATLMNKGLELIEAFQSIADVRADQLSAIIHPQSIIHAFVHHCDGSSHR